MKDKMIMRYYNSASLMANLILISEITLNVQTLFQSH